VHDSLKLSDDKAVCIIEDNRTGYVTGGCVLCCVVLCCAPQDYLLFLAADTGLACVQLHDVARIFGVLTV
jgi:hypothetical protein